MLHIFHRSTIMRKQAVQKLADQASGYLLSKKEERVGSPEKPLSGLGEVTYKKYWSLTVMRYLRYCTGRPTLDGAS